VETYELYRPSPIGSQKKRSNEDQKRVHDGSSCNFEDERSKTNYLGHGEIG
jgi:hypothetical protein